MRLNTRAISKLCASLLALSSVAACGEKSEPAAAPTEAGQPVATTPAAGESPTPEAAKPATKPTGEVTGVTFTLSLAGTESTLKLSAADLAARPKGSPLAVFNCRGFMGGVSVTDFAIGDDAARKGELFSAQIGKTGIGQTRAGQAEAVRISHRRAGESTQTTVEGMATWDERLLSGSATGTDANGAPVILRWTCDTAAQ